MSTSGKGTWFAKDAAPVPPDKTPFPGGDEASPAPNDAPPRSFPPTLTLDDKDLRDLIDCGMLDRRCATVTALRQQLDVCRKQKLELDRQHEAPLADAAGAAPNKRRKLSPETQGKAGKGGANNASTSTSQPWKPDHVRVHLRNVGDDLLCELNLDLKTLKGMPTVGRLRREFAEHVRKQKEIYEYRITEIIKEGLLDEDVGGDRRDGGKFTFHRRHIRHPDPGELIFAWGETTKFFAKNSVCFSIPGATFHASSSLGFEPDRPFIGEFFFEGRPQIRINEKSKVQLLVRDPNHDPTSAVSTTYDGSDPHLYEKRMMILALRRSGKFPLGVNAEDWWDPDHPMTEEADTFHCFAKYVSDVASKDPNSRDLVLGPDVFITDAYLNEHQAYYDAFDEFWQANGYPDDTKVTPGVPWTIKFVSLEAKNRFVEFCQALSAALRLTYARPEDDLFGEQRFRMSSSTMSVYSMISSLLHDSGYEWDWVYNNDMLPEYVARLVLGSTRTKIEEALSAQPEQLEAFQRWEAFCVVDGCADFLPKFSAAENGLEAEPVLLSDDSYDLRQLVGARVAEPDDEGANHDGCLIQLRVAPVSFGPGFTGRGVLFRDGQVVQDPDA